MSAASRRRMNRFFDRYTGQGLLLPADHGLTCGPLAGIETTDKIASLLKHPEITGIIAHKGIIQRLQDRQALDYIAVLVHLNGMPLIAGDPDTKEILTSVETAARLGAEGVSIQINFSGKNDAHNLKLLGRVKDEAMRLDLPVLTMLYDKMPGLTTAQRTERMRQLLRMTIELGSDCIKIALPETDQATCEILRDLHEDAAILIAGGSIADEEALMKRLKTAIKAGARGFCIGRNIFERKAPSLFLKQLTELNRKERPLPFTITEYAHS